MYAVSPIYEHGIHIDVPSCMYTMQNLAHEDGSETNTKVNGGEREAECLLNDITVELTNLDFRLDNLISKFQNNNAGNSKQPISTTTKYPKTKVAQRPPQPKNIILHLSPDYKIPLSLIAVIRQLSDGGHFHRLRTFRHSSIRSNTAPLPLNLFDNMTVADKQASSLDIIFKEVEFPTLILSGEKWHLQGTASILRFFGRRLRPSYDADVSQSALVDYFIDVATALPSMPAKQRTATVKSLSHQIQRGGGLFESGGVTLADLAMYSAFSEDASIDVEVGGPLGKWAAACRTAFNL